MFQHKLHVRGLFGHFYSRLSYLFSFSLALEDGPIQTEILSRRAVEPKTTDKKNQFSYKWHLDGSFCKDLMVNTENSPIRTFMLSPKHVTFTPWYGQLVLGNTLRVSALVH